MMAYGPEKTPILRRFEDKMRKNSIKIDLKIEF